MENGKNKNLIPKGHYCYTIKKIVGTRIEINLCLYWDKKPEFESQMNGYCHFLGTGDMCEDGTSLLWDQVKECGINFDDGEENID